MNPQVWWHLARATGLVAWALATATVLWGLFLHSRALGTKPAGPWLLDLHRHLATLTLATTALHLVGLVADNAVSFDLVDLTIPMASSWRPGAVALGVVAGWILVAVQVTSMAMHRIPRRVWRGIHLSSYAAFALATAHGVAAGTDMGNPLAQWGLLAGILALAFFAAYRQLAPRRATRAARTGSARRALIDAPPARIDAPPARAGAAATR